MRMNKLVVGMVWLVAVPRMLVAGQADPVASGIRDRSGMTHRAERQASQRERLTETFVIGEGVALDLQTVSGDIEVVAGDVDRVTVEISKRARGADEDEARRQLEQVEIEITERGGRVEVRGVRRDGNGGLLVSLSYDVLVPSATPIVAKTVSGDLSVTNAQGEVRVETVSGDLDLVSVNRLTFVKTVSGDVRLQTVGAEEGMEVSTVEGDVRAEGVGARSFAFTTVSGSADLSDMRCDRVTVNAVSGDVEYAGPLTSGGRYELQAHSGDIDVIVVGETGFELEAKSVSGRLGASLAADEVAPAERTRGRGRRGGSLERVYGDGRALLVVTTFSGDIGVNRR